MFHTKNESEQFLLWEDTAQNWLKKKNISAVWAVGLTLWENYF